MKAGILGIVMVAAISINLVANKEKDEFSPLMLANIEALADNEDQSGKICYYKGTSTYADYIPCTADYPNIGSCGTRETAYYSTDKAQCLN